MTKQLSTLELRLVSILAVMMTVRGISISKDAYCKMDCHIQSYRNKTVRHTMCDYPENGPNYCNRTEFRLTRADKRWILEQMNNARVKVARGEEGRGAGGQQPQASNMMKLVWNGELAMIGRRWADQCDRGPHDLCRTPLDSLKVGQNSYIGRFDEQQLQDRYGRLSRAIDAWLGEVVRMKPAWVNDYPEEAKRVAGNYSQLVWGATDHVGCGYAEFRTGYGKYSFRLVCNFKPAGNEAGMRVYMPGEPCSSCPPNVVCSVTWVGLCFTGEQNYFVDQEVDDSRSPEEFLSIYLFIGLLLLLRLI